MKLYEIDEGIRAVLEMIEIDEETGEIFGDIQSLSELQYEAEQQMESIGCYIKELELEAQAIANTVDSLKRRMLIKRKKAERMRDYLSRFTKTYLESVGKSKYETPNVKLSFRRSQALEVQDEKLALDEARLKGLTKTSEELDITAIKLYIAGGNPFESAKIVEKSNIQIA